MRHYECRCLTCGHNKQIAFLQEPYLNVGDQVLNYCKICMKETPHVRIMTHKAKAELNQKNEELIMKNAITDQCNQLGFTCRFVLQSVVISTPLADWCFDYHQPRKTLYHESTIKINFETGDYSNSHRQFVDRKMSTRQVIEYIAAHEQWKVNHRK